MFRAPTGVVRDLIIINVLMYFGTLIVMGEPSIRQLAGGGAEFVELGRMALASFIPGSPNFQPYQIFTHMFMHGDLGHLFFNMLSLYFFGPQLEAAWGTKKFLFYYLATGLGAWVISTGITYFQLQGTADFDLYHSVGASGAIFGILAGFGYMFPNAIIQMIFPPIPMKAKYFVLIFGGLELFYGVRGMQTGIAHFAHVGGAVIGFMILMYWYGFRFQR